MAKNELTLTPELVRDWRQKRDGLRAEINAKLVEVARLEDRIKAAEVLMPTPPPTHIRIAADTGVAQRLAPAADDGADNMTAKIEEIANNGAGITHSEMKAKLRALGFPEDRLGNYYYTAVHRLKTKNRIAIGADKKIAPVF